jgi:hypothetical protein
MMDFYIFVNIVEQPKFSDRRQRATFIVLETKKLRRAEVFCLIGYNAVRSV